MINKKEASQSSLKMFCALYHVENQLISAKSAPLSLINSIVVVTHFTHSLFDFFLMKYMTLRKVESEISLHCLCWKRL